MRRVLRFASAGLGQQSTAMIVAMVLGEPGFPTVDGIGFADTGDEQDGTYAHAAKFAPWLAERGATLVTRKKKDPSGSLSQSIMDRLAGKRQSASPIPAHLKGAGRAMQGCTRDWKARQVDAYYRLIVRREKPDAVEVCIGFGIEEVHRAKTPSYYHKVHHWPVNWSPRYPLIDLRLGRGWAVEFNHKHLSWPVVPSMCRHCPNRPTIGPSSFEEMSRKSPADFEKVVAFDAAIRDGTAWGLEHEAYLSAYRLPLREAIKTAQMQMTLPFPDGAVTEDCSGRECFT